MKILTKKEYQKLKDIEKKYEYITGQIFTIYISGRSRKYRLMQLPKEELVKMIFDLGNELNKIHKKNLNGDSNE